MLEMCWKKRRKPCRVSLLCHWIGGGCVPAQNQLQVEPRGRTEFNSSFVNFGVTLPSNKKFLYSYVFWRGKNPSLSRFLQNDFCFCKHSVRLIVILRSRATRLENLKEKCEGNKGIFKIRPDFTKHELTSAFCKALSTLNHREQNKACLWGWAGHRALIYSCQKVIEIKTLSLCVQYFFYWTS